MNAYIPDEEIKWENPPLQATLTPAYGMDFTSKGAVLHDFRSGKNFVANLLGRRGLCNVFDFKAGDLVKIRYNFGACVAFCRIAKSDVEFT